MATPTLKYVAPTTPEDELSLAPEPVVIYGVPSGGGGGSTAWSDITGKPTTFTPSAHTQSIVSITGLQAELDSKATPDEIPTTPGDIGAATSAQGALADTAVQPAALSGYVPTTRTVAGKALTANVTLAKADVGLGSVDNTADSAKPVSTAQQMALDAKVPTSRTVAGRALTADVPRAALNTLGLGEAIFIPKNGTVPGGTPTYTIVIEAEA